MNPIRVLVVDDSSTVRLILSRTLGAFPELVVAETAANGRLALDILARTNVDLVLLDVEMPELDGLATLAEIRKTHPKLPVVMFSRLTKRGVRVTIDALFLGANDYVKKPESAAELETTIQTSLVPKIKALAGCPAAVSPLALLRDTRPDSAATGDGRRPTKARPDVVAVAASTGGPTALADLLAQLDPRGHTPLLVVQHMPPEFTSALAERLAAKSGLDVREASAAQEMNRAQVWIAPGDKHLVVYRDGATTRVATNQDPPENLCRPSADVLFRSVAATFGPRSLAIVLTGMGHDGTVGCRTIREAGGEIAVQDERSSVVWGMPGSVAKAGLADTILPVNELGRLVRERTRPNHPT